MGGEYERAVDSFEGASREYFDAAVRDGTYLGVMLETEAGTVGGGGVVIAHWPGSPMNRAARRAWILNIYVEREYRGRGYATAIMGRLIEWCRENGFESVALHASEAGRPIYEKLGFRQTNEMRLRF